MSWLLSPAQGVIASSINSQSSTDGWVLTSDGAGNTAWEAVPAGGGEINDLTAAVVWDDIPIANVPTGTSGSTVSLGNHTHLEADITDLGTYLETVTAADIDAEASTDGWVLTSDGAGNTAWEAVSAGAEVNDLSAAVTWTNIPIANVPTGTTSSTVSLGNHTHDSITDTNLVDKSADEVISGHWAAPSTINTQNGSYTMVLGDAGKTIHKASGGAGETITIPANGSVAYALGTLIAIENDGGGTLTVAITTDTLTWSEDNTTGSRTLADGGALVIQKMTATTWKCAGSQVT